MFNNRKVSILMASFPYRKFLMLSAIKELIDQCDNFYLWLNEYTEIPEELNQYGEKLHIKINVPNIKDNGRYTFLDECKDDYCFICDDDINWPKNYVQQTLDCFKRHNDHIMVAYYVKSTGDFIAVHNKDTVADIKKLIKNIEPHYGFGSGTCVFIPSVIGFQVKNEELMAGYDVELFLGNICIKNKIPIISPARKAHFLTWKHLPGIATDKFALHKNGNMNRIKKTIEYIDKTSAHAIIKTKSITYTNLLNYAIGIESKQQHLDIGLIGQYHQIDFQSIFNRRKTLGIENSHYEAVRYAKANNWPFIFILEDTAYPIENVKSKLIEAISNIPAETGLLTLGNIEFVGSGKKNGNYIEFTKNIGLHSFILFSTHYDDFLATEQHKDKSTVLSLISKRYAYIKCLFICAEIDDSKIKYICKNKDVIKQCPTFDEIQSWMKFRQEKIKVANITNLSDWNNYGQRLQTYALQKYIAQHFNINVYTFDTRSFFSSFGTSKCFDEFNAKYINFIKIRSFTDCRTQIPDIILVGGDQNWNRLNSYYTGKFYENSAKLVSYSSSATNKLDIITSKNLPLVKQLYKFKKISFREKKSAESVNSQYAKMKLQVKADYHIDPVFLLPVSEWRELEQKPAFIKDDEIFDFSYQIDRHINTIQNNNGIKNYMFYGNNNNKDNITPNEFLWMLDHCRKFYTSSFHGIAFSILFNKNFSISNDKKNDSRIQNLINILSIKFENSQILNYSEVNQNIQNEIIRSFAYLKSCFEITDFKYTGYSKAKLIRDKSTSGGISAILASQILKNNGIVFGAQWSEDFKSVKIDSVESMSEYFAKISKSKYNFSFLPKLSRVKELLDSNKTVLFTGCPCQINCLNQFLNHDYENLVTVDILCNGLSQSSILKQFIENQESIEKSKIIAVDMRYQHCSDLYLKFQNGKIKILKNIVTKTFVCNKTNYMNKCLTCKNNHGLESQADLTIGDFWDYSKYKNRLSPNFSPSNGTSVIFIHTCKGLDLFNKIKDQLNYAYLF